MRFVTTIHLLAILDSILGLLTAFVLGTPVGPARQYRQRSAGLRTNTLVAVGAAAFVLAGNPLLRPVVARMERRPLDQRTGELRLEIRVTTDAENLAAARRHVIERLQAAQYPVADIDVTPVGEEAFEIIALLTATTAAPAELDAVVAELSRHPGIRHAAWESASLD